MLIIHIGPEAAQGAWHEPLERAGHTIKIAETVGAGIREGRQAVTRSAEGGGGVGIVLDVAAGRVTAADALTMLRQRFPNVPLVALSTGGSAGEREEVLARGATGYLVVTAPEALAKRMLALLSASAQAPHSGGGAAGGGEAALREAGQEAETGSEAGAADEKQTKILVAAGSSVVRQLLQRIAAASGCRVVGQAGTATEVAERYGELAPDGLFVDMELPPSDAEVALKAMERFPAHGPVLVFGSSIADSRQSRFLVAGAAACFSKSAEIAELATAIKNVFLGASAARIADAAWITSTVHVCYVGPAQHLARLLRGRLPKSTVVAMERPDEVTAYVASLSPDVVLIDAPESADEYLFLAAGLAARKGKVPVVVWLAENPTGEWARIAVGHRVSKILRKPIAVAELARELVAVAGALSGNGGADAAAAGETTGEEALESVNGMLARLRRLESIQAAPMIVSRVLAITSDEGSGSRDLEKAILADSETTAVVLRRANSPIFASVRKISSPGQAIIRVGFNEVRSLVLGLSVIKHFETQETVAGFDPLAFWKASLASAVLAKILARKVGLPGPDECFIAGLLADFGKVILEQNFRDLFARSLSLATARGIPLATALQQVFGVDHTFVGSYVLEQWRFPKFLVDVVRIFNSPAKISSFPDETVRRSASVVRVARWAVQLYGMGDTGEHMIALALPEVAEGMERIGSHLGDATLGLLADEMTDLASFLGAQARFERPAARSAPPVRLVDLGGDAVEGTVLLITGAGLTVERYPSVERLLEKVGEPCFQHWIVARRAAELAAELAKVRAARPEGVPFTAFLPFRECSEEALREAGLVPLDESLSLVPLPAERAALRELLAAAR
ncbi:MAG: HDOD domain-containing protein [Candidatus Schekmanbacteria bacterium]|nr:HDOD domain-containing protein [Candidatus Schekmanbacteria bacterium]